MKCYSSFLGHQPTFSSIHWHAAFVGFSGSNYGTSESSASFLTTMVLPATLIGWNTFTSRLLFTLALPSLMLAPFCLWLTCPSIRRHFQSVREEAVVTEEDFQRGEVFLLERPEEAKSQLFKLCCKFVCLLVRQNYTPLLASNAVILPNYVLNFQKSPLNNKNNKL